MMVAAIIRLGLCLIGIGRGERDVIVKIQRDFCGVRVHGVRVRGVRVIGVRFDVRVRGVRVGGVRVGGVRVRGVRVGGVRVGGVRVGGVRVGGVRVGGVRVGGVRVGGVRVSGVRHYDRRAQYDMALAKIEEAMQHTPTIIDPELYAPTLTLQGVFVKVAESESRENCLSGYIFLLESSNKYILVSITSVVIVTIAGVVKEATTILVVFIGGCTQPETIKADEGDQHNLSILDFEATIV
ncbi:hypothetical protein Tco_0923958 [Tanacetum coccineum]|uniref:Uncharacterized protein n=1 Tax=Tanacetum coccineum TaxID=301880 RepID=A0ABQ5D8U7_9ASTR